ncbi:caspase-1-like isoform X2 [Phymastichus coffea]|uniref:caspase-1-like isoform X2 n=1 Tax=Phymastichus coffea TaxID=108790 RepID=UPI00273C2E7C|nr:caspase-1-like isoform X2 [Phymastichus coffea]
MYNPEENNDENGFQKYYIFQNDDDQDEMSCDRERQYPGHRTPGKRQRRTSDVIDSMGESPLFLPAASTSNIAFSGIGGPSTPSSSSIGIVTPQRPTHCRPTVSPDQGYGGTPEMSKTQTCTPEWLYSQPVSSPNSQLDTSIAQLPSSIFSLSGKLEVVEDANSLSISASARMTVHRDSEIYNMQHKNRGKCVIFNHENFTTGYASRRGSTCDAQRIEETFQRLGFTVEICDDYELSAITNKINELSGEDHTDNDCLCIFLLTHGMGYDMISAKDALYKSESIWKPFTADRCRTLAGKPKLFFFQACRGDNLDSGVQLFGTGISRTETDSFSYGSDSYKIPSHADFLFAHSTAPGFYSWRDPLMGTWYVQSLCDILDQYAATTDLVKMLTMTARKVAIHYASCHEYDPTLNDQKQVPTVTSMLIRDLYFTPKSQ